MNSKLAISILEALERVSGSGAKEATLAGGKDDPAMVELLDACFKFSRKFFLKQIPEIKSIPGITEESSDHIDEFMALLKQLETRQITGDIARNQTYTFLLRCGELERKWYTRVLLKDLRCGVGISTINKAGFKIPEFEVMLAKDGKQCKNLNAIISKGVWVSRKYDGYRCLAVVQNGEATLYTRNGKEYTNFPSIQAALVKTCDDIQDSMYVFDGEIMSNDFNAMQQSAFASKRGTTVGDVKYHIFDSIDPFEWSTQKFSQLACDRFKHLNLFFASWEAEFDLPLVKVEHEWTKSLDRVLELEREYIAAGYEGAMVLPDIPYYLGRKTNAMMKFKTMLSMDCKVVGVYEGSGKYAGSLGGLHLLQENGLPCDVGSGFTDQERSSIFIDPKSVEGRVLEVKYQNLSDDGIMRFPIAMRWREDKS